MNQWRSVYVVLNTEGGIGAADWREQLIDLPSYDEHDRHFVLNVPANEPADKITDAMDCLLGDYDLPAGYVLVEFTRT